MIVLYPTGVVKPSYEPRSPVLGNSFVCVNILKIISQHVADWTLLYLEIVPKLKLHTLVQTKIMAKFVVNMLKSYKSSMGGRILILFGKHQSSVRPNSTKTEQVKNIELQPWT